MWDDSRVFWWCLCAQHDVAEQRRRAEGQVCVLHVCVGSGSLDWHCCWCDDLLIVKPSCHFVYIRTTLITWGILQIGKNKNECVWRALCIQLKKKTVISKVSDCMHVNADYFGVWKGTINEVFLFLLPCFLPSLPLIQWAGDWTTGIIQAFHVDH